MRPFEGGRVGLACHVVDALLVEPANARLGRALMLVEIEFGGKISVTEYARFAESQAAQRACSDACDPCRHTDDGGDHGCGQHRLVEQARIAFQHGRADAAAHRMAVQVQWLAARVFAAHSVGEGCEIGHVPTPIVDPHQAGIAHVVCGMTVPAVFEDAYGIAGQQKVPCHLAVFSREFGESMRDDHHATEHARSAVLTQRIEFGRVVTAIVQPAGFVQFGQRVAVPVNGGWIHPSFRHAGVQRGQHLAFHFGVVIRLVEQPKSHAFIIRIPHEQPSEPHASAPRIERASSLVDALPRTMSV